MDKQLLIVLGLAVGTLLMSSKVRGIRNNNWLNIKYSPANQWEGMIGPDDKNFVRFTDPVYSLRAGFKILNTYRTKYNINTIFDIIHRFAPSNENKTAEYIKYVSQKSGINPYQQLIPNNWPLIIQAMAKMEVGTEPPLGLVNEARNLASV